MPEDKEPHGNSKKSKKEQHLYVIIDNFDKTETKVAKYGISGEKLNKDGSSKRANNQVNKLNSISGFVRFIAYILIKEIKGREAALEFEQKYTNDFAKKNGGNQPSIQTRPQAKNKNED